MIAGAILVREGLPWVASNTDLTVPTPRRPRARQRRPGGAVARFAEREPDVAGKPEPPLFEETLRRVGGERPLVVGDRLDTDIEGANRVGYDSLLVMTGVTDLATLASAAPGAASDVRRVRPRRPRAAARRSRGRDGDALTAAAGARRCATVG